MDGPKIVRHSYNQDSKRDPNLTTPYIRLLKFSYSCASSSTSGSVTSFSGMLKKILSRGLGFRAWGYEDPHRSGGQVM